MVSNKKDSNQDSMDLIKNLHKCSHSQPGTNYWILISGIVVHLFWFKYSLLSRKLPPIRT